jgi:hypothetical protein
MLYDAEIGMIRRCRGDHSRIGYALMLCYLRHPGHPLHANERPPAALVSYVAKQIDVSAEALDDYLTSEHVRAIHLDPARGHPVHRARLAREANRTTAQDIAEYERQRRRATLVALTLDLITRSLRRQPVPNGGQIFLLPSGAVIDCLITVGDRRPVAPDQTKIIRASIRQLLG